VRVCAGSAMRPPTVINRHIEDPKGELMLNASPLATNGAAVDVMEAATKYLRGHRVRHGPDPRTARPSVPADVSPPGHT
jgi:hypothetical protein